MATAPSRFRIGLALLGLVAALAPLPAAAEDFTGFYAGFNAGHGWRTGRTDAASDARAPGAGTPLPAWGKAPEADGLPPSAARAADRNPFLTGKASVR